MQKLENCGNMTNNNTTLIRIGIETYHKLDKLRTEKKRRNLQETGQVGDADFDGIINDLLNNSYQPNKQHREKKDGGSE